MRTRFSDVFLALAFATWWIGLQCCWAAYEDHAFMAHGRTAVAQPVRQVRAVPYERGGQVRHIDYDANLTFTTASGDTVTARRVRVTEAQRDSLVAGQTLVLQYLPDDPTTVRFPGWQRQSATTTWIVMLIAVASSATWWFVRRREHRRLRAAFGPRKYDGPLHPPYQRT